MCSGMQSMNSCGSQNTTVQSAASQSTVIDVDHVDKSIPMSWYLLSRAEQLEKLAAADKAVDMLWFVHGLAFNLINSPSTICMDGAWRCHYVQRIGLAFWFAE